LGRKIGSGVKKERAAKREVRSAHPAGSGAWEKVVPKRMANRIKKRRGPKKKKPARGRVDDATQTDENQIRRSVKQEKNLPRKPLKPGNATDKNTRKAKVGVGRRKRKPGKSHTKRIFFFCFLDAENSSRATGGKKTPQAIRNHAGAQRLTF